MECFWARILDRQLDFSHRYSMFVGNKFRFWHKLRLIHMDIVNNHNSCFFYEFRSFSCAGCFLMGYGLLLFFGSGNWTNKQVVRIAANYLDHLIWRSKNAIAFILRVRYMSKYEKETIDVQNHKKNIQILKSKASSVFPAAAYRCSRLLKFHFVVICSKVNGKQFSETRLFAFEASFRMDHKPSIFLLFQNAKLDAWLYEQYFWWCFFNRNIIDE